LLPPAAVPAIAAKLRLPATADEWLARRGAELDERLKYLACRLRRRELEGVELRDGRLHGASVKAATPPEAEALATRIDGMLPCVRITELMHEVSRAADLAATFTNLRTGERCDSENALLAAILADATNLGLTRMAVASQGVTRDQLIWTADAYIRPETYKAALARIIGAHHALPIAAIWGDSTTSSSDGRCRHLLELHLHRRCHRARRTWELCWRPRPLTWEHIGFSGDFLWDRAAATASKRRPLDLRHMREAAQGPLSAKSSPLALLI
jgi:Tn3 transposase DDE domain